MNSEHKKLGECIAEELRKAITRHASISAIVRQNADTTVHNRFAERAHAEAEAKIRQACPCSRCRASRWTY